MFGYSIISLKKHFLRFSIPLILSILVLVFQASPLFSQQSESAEILVKERGGIALNQANFNRVEYVGQCAGAAYLPSKVSAQFVSNTTPPAVGRRALIRNVTEGISSDPYPFTDREYERDRYSEGFTLQIGYNHSQQDFSVINGENQLEYEIKEANGDLVERGTITLQVSVNEQGVFPRDAICREEWQCTNERRDNRTDRICRTHRSCQCP
jgi:hypothetical protein